MSSVGKPPVMLAPSIPWDFKKGLIGWVVSEKWDGVRFWWDGSKFVSRIGTVFHTPKYITDMMPAGVVLDGEFYIGPNKFQLTSGIVRRHDWGEDGKLIRLHFFDVPSLFGSFRLRTEKLKKIIAEIQSNDAFKEHSSKLFVTEQEVVISRQWLLDKLDEVEKNGGEGLIAKDPDSLYKAGRQKAMLKIITKQRDEAKVTGYTQGTGRRESTFGAVICHWRNGVEFEVGTGFTDEMLADPPKIGDVIVVEFKRYTDDGKPREPAYKGTRSGGVW